MAEETPVPVRRFENKTSTVLVKEELELAGYTLMLDHRIARAPFRITRIGADPKKDIQRLTQDRLFQMVDRLRIARGLEPIRKRK